MSFKNHILIMCRSGGIAATNTIVQAGQMDSAA